ncbi:HN1_G0056970.mRNA.1.CDS.1 [Saccharomyces cerevisiae]|nr:HN1_G0049430.mRNA.1.CDS.1 [Saccharomyces cerevisiae]CAD6629554.1 HN1_G0056970.mRNA.1.CDS.1 [Saccharomyces cerevisiae]CAI4241448.1 BAL_1a_G0000890.mRNA.1.CDS.1 [Saccharomyces cerevisiae]CAI4512631.1 BAL_1a_G0025100.mRNA.1.CDS.1 [Saccharomyces cerevisiae]CAI7036417.1 BAL_1a_G0000890.mRNA.1.CDS.1 [Saccharomyces cerevisiae]
MGMKQVQEFTMEPKGSVFFSSSDIGRFLRKRWKEILERDRGPTEESERLLSQGLLSATSPRKTNAVRVAVRLGSRALQGQKRSISRLRRNSALSLSRVATEISCLFH